MAPKLKHDALVKQLLTNQVAAQEFLSYYLPLEFKELIDLNKITVEQESFVEDNLRKYSSDIIYKINSKDNKPAFVYVLLEAQSTIDRWIH